MIPEVHWPSSTVYLVSFRLVNDPSISKSKIDMESAKEHHQRLSFGHHMHVCMNTCVCTQEVGKTGVGWREGREGRRWENFSALHPAFVPAVFQSSIRTPCWAFPCSLPGKESGGHELLLQPSSCASSMEKNASLSQLRLGVCRPSDFYLQVNTH